MTPALRESRNAVKKAGRATTFLVVLSVALMVVLVGTFAYLNARQNNLQDSIREDALWGVYQIDREARALAQTVDRAAVRGDLDVPRIDELGLRYDILYSRLSVLDNAKYEASLAASDGFQVARKAIRERILALEPFFNDLASSQRLNGSALGPVGEELAGLVPLTERMLTDTNTSVAAARSDARAEVMWIQQATAILVLIISMSIGLLILNLMGQLRHTRRTTDQLEAAAEEISAAFNAAEAGNRSKSEFMAVMGHEIRTPLNAILGMAELLSEADLPEEDRQGVRVIASSGEALLEIINEILDFAKIEHGDLLLEKLPFDARKLVRDAVEVMAGRASAQGDDITVTAEDAVSTTIFISDPTRLRRVLLNLLSNAVKFTRRGRVDVRVLLPAPDRLRFEVADTGIGISQEALPRLFNPFTQEDGTISRRFGGTGLGLAICKKIVEAMGGQIGVSSTLGSGSVFWFEVPVETSQALLEDTPQAETSGSLPILDVLVVEDNPVNRAVARRFLDRLGQKVCLAVDGAEGVMLAGSRTFDLVLMDMQMPVLDGIAATREIRKQEAILGRRTRIVAMTANASDTDRALCMEAGMDAFVAKPVTLARLAEVIRSSAAAPASPAPAPAYPSLDDPAAMPTAIDEARRIELVEAFGFDGLHELDESFFSDMAGILRDLHASLAAGDTDRADRALHSIMGAAANLGFTGLSSFAHISRSGEDPAIIQAGIEEHFALLVETRGASKAA